MFVSSGFLIWFVKNTIVDYVKFYIPLKLRTDDMLISRSSYLLRHFGFFGFLSNKQHILEVIESTELAIEFKFQFILQFHYATIQVNVAFIVFSDCFSLRQL